MSVRYISAGVAGVTEGLRWRDEMTKCCGRQAWKTEKASIDQHSLKGCSNDRA